MKQTKKRFRLLRILLGILILANMSVIFYFSAQSGADSGRTSGSITAFVARLTVSSFEELSPEEQEEILSTLHPIVRKLAHMTEFGSLGALVFLFVLTFGGDLLFPYLASLSFSVFYACTDELHQLFTAERGPSVWDVFIDGAGALITCSLLLCLCLLLRKRGRARFEQPLLTTYYAPAGIGPLPFDKIALASDLHDDGIDAPLEILRQEKPDLILIPGDLMDDAGLRDPEEKGYIFLKECAKIAPTFYSLGNHELACYHKGNPWRHPIPLPLTDEIRARIQKSGATLLENQSILHKGVRICGLTSGIHGRENCPNEAALLTFAKATEPTVLLCHHPEYYAPHLKDKHFSLILCGHAHGGHWRFFGRGIYAPGQGLFPKYTSGVLDGACVISRGMGNHTGIPRIGNSPEIVILQKPTS
jgi:predicted MPP superfamily phosphohydrolase